MEFAIFISKTSRIQCDKSKFTRLYLGTEFCQNLLPSTNELENALESAASLEFTLVTPYCTDEGLSRVEGLLNTLLKRRPDSEVVFNDWGVFWVLRERFPNLKPVMGRLLNRMKRGPRLMNLIDKIPQADLNYFRRSNLTVPVFRHFLVANGVKRAEFDNVLQGIDLNIPDLELSLYMPFAYVTSNRACLVNACDVADKEQLIGVFPCLKECQKYGFILESDVMPVKLIRAGNALFYENEALPPNLQAVSRIVIQPEVPV